MNTTANQLLIAVYHEKDQADDALKMLMQSKKDKLVGVQAAAVVRRDAENKLHVREVGELTPRKGLVGGAIMGAMLGLLTGGTGIVLGAAGALIGRVVGKRRDTGFANPRLEQLGESLKPGSSAFLAVIGDQHLDSWREAFRGMDTDLVTAAIADDVAKQLAAQNDALYTFLADQGVFEATRTVESDDQVDVSITSVSTVSDVIVDQSSFVESSGKQADEKDD